MKIIVGSNPTRTFKDNMLKTITMDEAVELVAKEVRELQGCKAMELIASKNLNAYDFSWPDAIEEAVQRGKIIEIEYMLPNMNWRIKSFYLPGGTRIDESSRLPN